MGALLHWTQANSFELVVSQNHGRPQGGQTSICPCQLESGTTNHFLENLTSAAQFRLIGLFLAMTLYLPIRDSHCTRARFIFLVSCSGELAVHSFALLCLQRQVSKLAIGLFYCWSLLRNNNMATNLLTFTSSYDIRRFAAPRMSLVSADILAGNASRLWLLIAVSRDARKRWHCPLTFQKRGITGAKASFP